MNLPDNSSTKKSSLLWSLLVFVIGIVISTQVAFSHHADTTNKNQQYFDYRVREALQFIQNRLTRYEDALLSTRGLFLASDHVSRADFQRYVTSLQLNQNFQGLQGIGFAPIVPAAQKASHIAAIRAQGFPEYNIYPDGERAIYTPVNYFAPVKKYNFLTFGFDMYSDKTLHAAMQDAMQDGLPTLSPKISLTAEKGNQAEANFIMFAPIYQNDQTFDTAAARRDNTVGWIYAPFLMSGFMEALLGEFDNELEIHIYDGDKINTESLIFTSSQSKNKLLAVELQSYLLTLFQHDWTVIIQPTELITEHFDKDHFILFEGIGLLLSLILAGVFYFILDSRVNIKRDAVQLKVNLQRQQQLLTKKKQRLLETQEAKNNALHFLKLQKFALDQHAIVSITDTSCKITYANNKFTQISGYSEAELLGQHHRITKSGHHSAAFFKTMYDTIYAGQVWSGTVCNRSKTGELYWVSTSIVPFKDESGKLIEFISIQTDITDLKNKENEIKLFARIIDQTNDIVIICDAQSIDLAGPRIIFVNKAFERVTGYSSKEAIGNTPGMLQGPQTDPAILDRIRNAVINNLTIRDELINYTKDGRLFWMEFQIFPITNTAGKITYWISIQRDITERKALETQLKEALISAQKGQKAAEILADAKTKFLANMSHEIRTPMNGVIGLSDLALQSTDTNEIQVYMQEIKTCSLDLMRILNDILDLTKLEAHQVNIEKQPFSLEHLLHSINRLFTLSAQKSGVEFDINCAPEVPTHLIGDSLRVRQVLTNLIGNAFKFTEKGHISLNITAAALESVADAEQVRVFFRIQDSGMGITADQALSIFDPFTQADSSITRRFGGTGLGLSISQQLAKRMSGDVKVERSIIGEGTTFIFEAVFAVDHNVAENAAAEQAENSPATPTATATPTSNFKASATPPPAITAPVTDNNPDLALLVGKRVLLVEDNRINQIVTSKMLEKLEMPFDVASDGEIALNYLKDHDYDLILMDIQMPIMGGLEATRLIRQNDKFKDVIIVAMSAGVTLDEKKACSEAGMNGFVHKPTAFTALKTEMVHQLVK